MTLRWIARGCFLTVFAAACLGVAAPPAVGAAGEDGAWSATAYRSLDGIRGHSVVNDPLRDRVLVFGGYELSNDVWELTDGLTSSRRLAPLGTPPAARHGHSAIYDPVRDRMIVFGGYGASPTLGDVWALSLSGAPQWSELTPSGTPPPARGGHVAIYDPVRDQMVVFGGRGPGWLELDDTWTLSLGASPTWTQLAPLSKPVRRHSHEAIYDPLRDRMVIFGGRGIDMYNDVWALPLAAPTTWTHLSTSGSEPMPSGRELHSTVYDPIGDRMIAYGGYNLAGAYLADVWAFALSGTPRWTLLAPTGTAPGGRCDHAAAYDPAQERMVMCGGVKFGVPYADRWTLSLAGEPGWTQHVEPAVSTVTLARHGHLAIHDVPRDRMLLFGGFMKNDLWSVPLSDLTVRQEIVVDPRPTARYQAAGIHDPVRDRVVVFGGYDTDRRNDVWELSLAGAPAWSPIVPAGSPPSPRTGHSGVYDPVRDRLLVFGGEDGGYRNDLWALSLSGAPAWTQLAFAGEPPPARAHHTAIYDPIGDRMVVFGGLGAASYDDVWALSLSGVPTWAQVFPSGAPPSARYAHSAIHDPLRTRMVVFGGWDGGYRSDVWSLSLSGSPEWTALAPSGTPPAARHWHRAIGHPAQDRMLMFGGLTGAPSDVDVWSLQWADAPVGVEPGPAPVGVRLSVWPSPATERVSLRLDIPRRASATVAIFDVTGRMRRVVSRGLLEAGPHTLEWDGRDDGGRAVPAGVYFCGATVGDRTIRRTVALVR